jgi:NAD kinase
MFQPQAFNKKKVVTVLFNAHIFLFIPNMMQTVISTTSTLSMYCDFHFHEMETIIKAVQHSEIEVRRYPILQVIVDDNPAFYFK